MTDPPRTRGDDGMIGYLFLGRGAVGLFDGRRWPTPTGGWGPWVTGRADAVDAVRAYRLEDLPYWLDDELWVVELDGDLRYDPRVIRASRGRLRDRVAAWDADAAGAMALTRKLDVVAAYLEETS